MSVVAYDDSVEYSIRRRSISHSPRKGIYEAYRRCVSVGVRLEHCVE